MLRAKRGGRHFCLLLELRALLEVPELPWVPLIMSQWFGATAVAQWHWAKWNFKKLVASVSLCKEYLPKLKIEQFSRCPKDSNLLQNVDKRLSSFEWWHISGAYFSKLCTPFSSYRMYLNRKIELMSLHTYGRSWKIQIFRHCLK